MTWATDESCRSTTFPWIFFWSLIHWWWAMFSDAWWSDRLFEEKFLPSWSFATAFAQRQFYHQISWMNNLSTIFLCAYHWYFWSQWCQQPGNSSWHLSAGGFLLGSGSSWCRAEYLGVTSLSPADQGLNRLLLQQRLSLQHTWAQTHGQTDGNNVEVCLTLFNACHTPTEVLNPRRDRFEKSCKCASNGGFSVRGLSWMPKMTMV